MTKHAFRAGAIILGLESPKPTHLEADRKSPPAAMVGREHGPALLGALHNERLEPAAPHRGDLSYIPRAEAGAISALEC